MLTELRRAKFNQIDADAARRKAAADHIVALIEDNEQLFRGVFSENQPPASKVEADEKLYDHVAETIDSLTTEYTRHFGVTIYRLRPGAEDAPAVKLGWATYEPVPSDPDAAPPEADAPHTMNLTETGLNVINGLRQVMELPTLEAERDSNRAAWKAAMSMQPPETHPSS